MVNSADFIGRLEKIMAYYGLSASAFADKIRVQRSSISHLLSGRNKPSLEFVMKVIKTFPDVNLYWLLNGKGSFPTSSKPETPTPKFVDDIDKSPDTGAKTIKKIVIFYEDGSFESYETKK